MAKQKQGWKPDFWGRQIAAANSLFLLLSHVLNSTTCTVSLP